MDTIKDFATSGPVIKAVAKVHDITIPAVVPIVRAAGRSVSIVNHYSNQYDSCKKTNHSIAQCIVAGSSAFLTEQCHRAVGGMAIGSSVELAATGIGAIPATGLATIGYKVFSDGRKNGDIIHRRVLESFDGPKKPIIKLEKFIIPGVSGIIGEYKQSHKSKIYNPIFKKINVPQKFENKTNSYLRF